MTQQKERCQCGCPENAEVCKGECLCHHTPTSQSEWIKDFERIFVMPNDWKPRPNEPIYDLDKRKEELHMFISTLLAQTEQRVGEEAKTIIRDKFNNGVHVCDKDGNPFVTAVVLKALDGLTSK